MTARKRGGILLVAYVGAYPEETVASLKGHEQYGWQLTVEALGNEHHAYADKLHELWTLCALAKTPLMTVEHDIALHQRVFDTFEECDQLYCVYPYWQGARYGFGLGCTRFRKELIVKHPDLIRVAGKRTNDGLPQENHYKRMDTRICDEARERGILKALDNVNTPVPCIHEPAVRHFNPTYAMPEPIGEDEQQAVAKFRRDHA